MNEIIIGIFISSLPALIILRIKEIIDWLRNRINSIKPDIVGDKTPDGGPTHHYEFTGYCIYCTHFREYINRGKTIFYCLKKEGKISVECLEEINGCYDIRDIDTSHLNMAKKFHIKGKGDIIAIE